MPSEMSLSDMSRNRKYEILRINSDCEYADKLEKLGFTPGVIVELGPSTIKDPLTVKIRGSRIALRKNEAHVVSVKEVVL